MHTWPVQDAKARFSELLDACLVAGPQMISRGGADVAVLVPVQEWQRLRSAERPSLKQLLLSEQARADMIMPARGLASAGKQCAKFAHTAEDGEIYQDDELEGTATS